MGPETTPSFHRTGLPGRSSQDRPKHWGDKASVSKRLTKAKKLDEGSEIRLAPPGELRAIDIDLLEYMDKPAQDADQTWKLPNKPATGVAPGE